MKRLLLPILAALALPTDVKASTYNFICTAERSHQISYIDKANEEDELTQGRSKYKEDIQSGEKFKVSFNSKNNNGFINNNPAKAIRIFAPDPFEYAPLFLYSEEGSLNESIESKYGKEFSITSMKLNRWNIRIDSPTDNSSMPFFSVRSLEDSENKYITNNDSDEFSEDLLTVKLTHEISTGTCFPKN